MGIAAALLFLLFVPTVQATPPSVVDTLGVFVSSSVPWHEADGDEFFDANVTVFFRLSTSDPDQVDGDFRYNMSLLETYFGVFTSTWVFCPGVSPGVACDDFTGSFGSVFPYYAVPDQVGWASVSLTMSGDPRSDNALTANLTADRMDLSFDARSGDSCTVVFDISRAGERHGCGVQEIPWTETLEGVPSFPLVDVPGVADSLGLSVGAVGTVFGFFVIAGFAFAGFRFGGAFIALGVGTLGLGFAVMLGLIPKWTLIIVAMAALGLAVTRFSGSRGEA